MPKDKAKPKAKGGMLVPPKQVAPRFPIKLITVKKKKESDKKRLMAAIKKLKQATKADKSAISNIRSVTGR